jgi:hypothetical protein
MTASLLDIPAFKPLGRLCNEFAIDFELFGGAVHRLIQKTGGAAPTRDNVSNIDLFDLSLPFSDFDLSHSGAPSLNAEIQSAILDVMPNSECFRWDLRSRSQWAIYRTAAHHNNRIPTRSMSLSTDPQVGFNDPLNGCTDIMESNYRYERNSAYIGSPLYRRRQDLELFSGLVYLQALFDSDIEPSRRAEQAGVAVVAAVMRDTQTLQMILALQESAYLRSRFRYLLAGLSALEPADDVLNRAGIRTLLDFIGGKDEHLSDRLRRALDGAEERGGAVTTSARIGGDIYRAPDTTAKWLEGEAARNTIADILTSGQSGVTLGDNEDVILASPSIKITPGSAPSNAPPGTQDRARVAQEFMYVNLKIPNWRQNDRLYCMADVSHLYAEEDIAILMAVRPSTKGPWSVHALPGGIGLRESRTLIRLNAWGLLEQLSLAPEPEIRVFLSGWRS